MEPLSPHPQRIRRVADRRIAVVTGANRGIGFEVVGELARDGFTVVLGARDAVKGEHALENLRAAPVRFWFIRSTLPTTPA